MKLQTELLKILEQLKITNFNKDKYVLIFSRHHANSSIRQGILAKCYNKLFKTNVIAVCEYKGDVSDKIYKKLNFKNIFYISDYFKEKKKNIFFNLKIFFEFFPQIIKFILVKNYIDEFVKNFKYKNALYGDLIYDTYIRKNHKFLKLNKNEFIFDFFKIYYLIRTKLDLIDKIYYKHKIKKVIISSKGFITTGNLALRFFSQFEGKKTIFFADNSYKLYKKNDYLKSFHNIEKKELNYFLDKNESKIKSHYNKKYNKLIISENSFVKKHLIIERYKSRKKKPTKFFINKFKIGIIALNAFSDSPHYQGKLLFRDYYDWFEKTINFINDRNISNTYWLIKPHPAQKNTDSMSYNETYIVNNVLNKNKCKNLELFPDNINNKDLFKYSTNLITCVSTIGLEFACYGKKPILCGQAIYSDLGFTNLVMSKKKYFNLLLNLPQKNKLTNNQILKAKAALYILDNIKTNKLNIKQNTLSLRYHKNEALSDDKYLQILSKNLKKFNVKNILDDEYFKKVHNLTKKNFKEIY